MVSCLYADIFRTVLLVVLLKITKVFGWKHLIMYLSLSALLAFLVPGKMMPERLLLYSAGAFAAYIIYGIIRHRIKCALTKKPVNAVPKQRVSFTLASALSIYSMGYFFRIISKNEIVSFILTIALFFAFGTNNNRYKAAWYLLFLAAITHSWLFFGGKNLLTPVHYIIVYLFTFLIFLEAKNAFSNAYPPKMLKAGMLPAESVMWDGKTYFFGNDPMPSLFALFRHIINEKMKGGEKRIVASFFVPLSKENISEIKKISKKHNRQLFLVQKRIDFLPFLVLGAIVTCVSLYL